MATLAFFEPLRREGSGDRRAEGPRIVTAVDLSGAAPDPRLSAEDPRFVIGVLIATPASLALWAGLWLLGRTILG